MSQTTLTRLIYASRRAGDPARDRDAEVRDILIASINNNRNCAISGLLVSHSDWFLQALEGPDEAVMNTYQRICADARHSDATALGMAKTSTRTFARWTMCATTMSDADQIILNKLVDDPLFDPFACDETSALHLLMTVAGLHGDLLTRQHAELMGEVLRAA